MSFSVAEVRKDFPILARTIRGKPLIYFDNGASTQRPAAVIERMLQVERDEYSNIHRGVHFLSSQLTARFEESRDKIAQWLGAKASRELIFTSGTTMAANLVAYSWGRRNLRAGDEVVVTSVEHHANFVPWQAIAKEMGARFSILELGPSGAWDEAQFKQILLRKPKLFAFSMMSNVLGTIYPVASIAALAKENGVITFCDAAQGIPHGLGTLTDWSDLDFLAFSAHKMCGPSGIGVLWGRESLLEAMPPFLYGGDMIAEVGDQTSTWNAPPWKFEAGTPPITAGIGFGAAIDYFKAMDRAGALVHEQSLTTQLVNGLSSIPGVTIHGPARGEERGSLVSFLLEGVHPFDLSSFLDTEGIAIRVGHHCAQPLMRRLGVEGTARASLFFYNTAEEVDTFVRQVKRARELFL